MLALAGIPRRLGWAMGGGGFLLTDIAPWNPARHEVQSRLALLEAIGIRAADPARVDVHVADSDRARVARGLHPPGSKRQKNKSPPNPSRTSAASVKTRETLHEPPPALQALARYRHRY